MNFDKKPFFDVVKVLVYQDRDPKEMYQVVLFEDEWYRTGVGNLMKRRVVVRKYNIFSTPLDAQLLAQKWNAEDGFEDNGKEQSE